MTRTVFAVDVTATMLSLSLLTETSDGSPAVPIKKLLPVPPAGDLAHTPRKTWDRALRAVDAAAETILPGGIPTLVMMARQQWADLGRDQSAGRRLEIHALLADRLHAAAVPVAEFPYPTVLQWLHDGQTSRRVGTTRARPSVMDDIAREVERVWGVKQPTYVSKDTEREISYPFRRQVIALAAVGGMAVGIPTAIDVTAKRLELLSGITVKPSGKEEPNASIQWPTERTPPPDVTKWAMLHEHPENLEPLDLEGEAERAARREKRRAVREYKASLVGASA
ncbi:hypothetical protein [Mycolicibacterium fallax]|uniref:Uncharacterized protein n=1 Tax=Mycolicibacterium fallax TaxID=1793 RepID=A0A1X1RJ52_MYCFA|nr:hypothetical protein [Mycolicibacterium fallax]MCB0929853.1 hypothetical protein [Mycobacterium sp.]ORV07555.1 hypothetical protein AWC04_03845 [Mycolicibacterium fallax]BBY99470.1 hypothetical protein MFAL_29370 [Mycolicibacterium fallax]